MDVSKGVNEATCDSCSCVVRFEIIAEPGQRQVDRGPLQSRDLILVSCYEPPDIALALGRAAIQERKSDGLIDQKITRYRYPYSTVLACVFFVVAE